MKRRAFPEHPTSHRCDREEAFDTPECGDSWADVPVVVVLDSADARVPDVDSIL